VDDLGPVAQNVGLRVENVGCGILVPLVEGKPWGKLVQDVLGVCGRGTVLNEEHGKPLLHQPCRHRASSIPGTNDNVVVRGGIRLNSDDGAEHQ